MSYITNSTTGIQYKNRDCVDIQWMLRTPLTNDKQNKTKQIIKFIETKTILHMKMRLKLEIKIIINGSSRLLKNLCIKFIFSSKNKPS